jgi:hypothetical protein
MHRTIAAGDFNGSSQVSLMMAVSIVRPEFPGEVIECAVAGANWEEINESRDVGAYIPVCHDASNGRQECLPREADYFFGQSGSNCLALSCSAAAAESPSNCC